MCIRDSKTTEWLGDLEADEIGGSHNYKRRNYTAKTTLINVRNSLSEPLDDLTFYHDAGGSTCATSFKVGYKRWFTLYKETDGALFHSYCSDQVMPIAALLDYHANGNDLIIPSQKICSVLKGKNSNLTENCTYWENDIPTKRITIMRNDREEFLLQYLSLIHI